VKVKKDEKIMFLKIKNNIFLKVTREGKKKKGIKW